MLQSKFARWQLPEFLCKFYLFVDFALKGIHAFLLVFGSLFLYFWYRKEESYATETGEIHTRLEKNCPKNIENIKNKLALL